MWEHPFNQEKVLLGAFSVIVKSSGTFVSSCIAVVVMRWRWWAACWAVCGPGLGWGATIVATLTSAVSLARPRARATDDGLLLSPSPAPAAARAHSWPAGPVRSRERRAALYWSEGDHRLPLQVVSCLRSPAARWHPTWSSRIQRPEVMLPSPRSEDRAPVTF